MYKKTIAMLEGELVLLKVKEKLSEAERYKMMSRSDMLDQEPGTTDYEVSKLNYNYWLNRFSLWSKLLIELTKLYRGE